MEVVFNHKTDYTKRNWEKNKVLFDKQEKNTWFFVLSDETLIIRCWLLCFYPRTFYVEIIRILKCFLLIIVNEKDRNNLKVLIFLTSCFVVSPKMENKQCRNEGLYFVISWFRLQFSLYFVHKWTICRTA